MAFLKKKKKKDCPQNAPKWVQTRDFLRNSVLKNLVSFLIIVYILAAFQEAIDGINLFFACYCKFGKPKSYFVNL